MAEEKQQKSGTLLTIALAIYVLVLMTAAADELFDLGIFPPELEKQIAVRLKDMHSPDAQTQQAAEKWLVEEGHQFAIRQLIDKLRDEQIRDKVAGILAKICGELDLEAQAKNAVTRLADDNVNTSDEAAWELVEIGHFGLPAILKAMRRPRTAIRARLRSVIVLATAMYFDDQPLEAIWKYEKLDAQAADLVIQLANTALANGAADKLKTMPHNAIPRLIDAVCNRQLRPKAVQVLAEITLQKPDTKWEEWYAKWWEDWYAKRKDKLGFGANYAQWKLWYRMNKDHL